MGDKQYTTIFVTKELKRRLDAIAVQMRRSAPAQIEYWCDLHEAAQLQPEAGAVVVEPGHQDIG